MSYGKDDTGHRGWSDREVAAEREALRITVDAFAEFRRQLTRAKGLSSLKGSIIQAALDFSSDWEPGAEQWESEITEAATDA